MPLSPVVLEKFGGLNLTQETGEFGMNGAADMLNVLVDRPGRLRVRDGWASYLGTTGKYTALHAFKGFGATPKVTEDFVMAYDTVSDTVRAVSSTGTIASPVMGGGVLASGMASFGGPTGSVFYVTSATKDERKFSGGVWSAASVGNGGHLAVTPLDNRMVAARYDFSAINPSSRVQFSDQGAPETFGVNNYVDLSPGDAEIITGMATWREYLFVFKNTKFFVFYGTSKGPTGEPEFNYRPVISGVGAMPGNKSCVAAEDGVYFVNATGLYRTTGSTPVKVSGVLDPFFRGQPTTYTGPAYSSAGQPSLGTSEGRVFLTFGYTIGTARTFIYDSRIDSWSVHDIPAAHMIGSPALTTGVNRVVFGDGFTSRPVQEIILGLTTDGAGAAITSKYRFGVSDLGGPVQKIVREIIADGTGVLDLSMGTDWLGPLPGTAVSVTLGNAPAVGRGRSRRAFRGRNFQPHLAASSGAWSINRLQLNVRSQRPVGVTK